MELRKKFIAAGAAGVLAIGGAGLYAGVLTTASDGDVGAGSVGLQASCASAAVIDPDEAVWDTVEQSWMYRTATVTYTTAADQACVGQVASVNVYDVLDGSELNVADPKVILEAEGLPGPGANSFVVTFGISTDGETSEPGIDAAIVAGDYRYGLVIQTASS